MGNLGQPILGSESPTSFLIYLFPRSRRVEALGAVDDFGVEDDIRGFTKMGCEK